MREAALAVRFLIELCALAALAYTGYETGGSTLVAWGLAVAIPLLAAIVWGLFVAPKRTFDIPELRAAFEVLVLGGAGLGLALTGHPWLGLAFAIVALVNRIVLIVLERKQPAT